MRNERCGVISRQQAFAAGVTRSAIAANLNAGRWQRLYRGVYLTHSGPISRSARLWAVLIAADGATFSHATAAELAGLTNTSASLVHVTIPAARRVMPLNDARVHYSNRLEIARHPTKTPAQTRIEETVLDLAGQAGSVDDAIGWLMAACGRRLSTPGRIATALALRNRIRWRRELTTALGEVRDGNHSILELRYVRAVERAHALPAAARQVPHLRRGGRIYDDVRYTEFRTVVELDGRLAHPAESAFRDLQRDNIAGVRGDLVLHYGWTDVATRPCEIAAQVAAVLRNQGWTANPVRCGPTCVIRKV